MKEEMIYVPSAKLYFSRHLTHLKENWYDVHSSLASEGYRMPTIPEFWQLLNHLKSNPTEENEETYDLLTGKRDPFRATWLDAYFQEKNGTFYLLTGNRAKREELENCLLEDRYADISSLNRQGLPTLRHSNHWDYVQGNNFFFTVPVSNSVARFESAKKGASLICDTNPKMLGGVIGVKEA